MFRKVSVSVLISVILSGVSAEISRAGDGIGAGPWVTNVSDSSLTVLWTGTQPGMGWVETSDGVRKYDTFAGRRTFGLFHSVRLTGLPRGGDICYRVGGQVLTDDSNPRYPVFGEEYAGEWHTVRTYDSEAGECHFAVMNDIHMDTTAYKSLVSQIRPEETDFILLNGDIISTGNYVREDYVKWEIQPLSGISAVLPVQFSRGNHEGRGTGIEYLPSLFPNDVSEAFYYTFRQGPVAFIVLDGGETGPDRSLLYCGEEQFTDYIEEQLEWARKAVTEPSFKDAPVKVCIVHSPMIDSPEKDKLRVQRYLNHHVVPLLNEAGIDLMIGADLHHYLVCDPGSMGNDFPIVVNASCELMDCRWRDGRFHIRTFSPEGELRHEIKL